MKSERSSDRLAVVKGWRKLDRHWCSRLGERTFLYVAGAQFVVSVVAWVEV